jgi:hypothetical protein
LRSNVPQKTQIQQEEKITKLLSDVAKRVEESKSDEAKNAALKAEMPEDSEDPNSGPENGSPAADAMQELGKAMATAGPTMGEMLNDLDEGNDAQNTKDT